MEPPQKENEMIQNKDPPEELHEGMRGYALGDTCKPEHMAEFHTADDNLLAVARLKPNDHCFILRSGGRFAFAKVLSQQHGPEAQVELQVNGNESTKTIPMNQYAKYIRTIKRSHHAPPSSPHIMRRRGPRRPSFDAPPQRSRLQRQSSLHGSFQSGLNQAPPQRGLQRQSSVHTVFHSGLNNNSPQKQPRRQSNSLHVSSPAGLNNVQSKPTMNHRQSNRRASFQSSRNTQPARENERRPSLHASFNSDLNRSAQEVEHVQSAPPSFTRPALRRGSSLRCSISTHVPEHAPITSNEEIELSSDVESNSGDSTTSASSVEDEDATRASNSASSSSDGDTPRASSPRDENMRKLRDSVMKKVSLPGFENDIEFNGESLRKAFSTIGCRGTKASKQNLSHYTLQHSE